jgi:hypothetical protein
MNESRPQIDDDALLEAVARLWRQLDPPPEDLAHGVLARIAAEDLEPPPPPPPPPTLPPPPTNGLLE